MEGYRKIFSSDRKGREMMTTATGKETEKGGYFSTGECFRAALVKLLKDRGYGAQVLLAEAVGRGAKHMNDVVCGRRYASMEMQDRIALFFDMVPEEMMAFGRRLLKEGGDPFPYAEEAAQYTDPKDRGNFILKKTIEELGLKDNPFFMSCTLDEVLRHEWDIYVAGDMGDGRLYNRTKEEIKQIGAIVSKHFAPKRGRKRQKPKKS
jgi:hypothetical protein